MLGLFKKDFDFSSILQNTHTLFVLADDALVATFGREELEQFCLQHGMQPTADLERFVQHMQFLPEELKQFKEAVRTRTAYSNTVIIKHEDAFTFSLTPLEEPQAKWALALQSVNALPAKKPGAKLDEEKTSMGGWDTYQEHTHIPSVLLSADGQVERVNRAFKELLPERLKDKHDWRFLECIAETSKEPVASWFMDAIGVTGPIKSIEVKLKGNDSVTLAMFISRLFQDISGRLLVQMVDLTEQKNLELHFAHSQKMQAVGQLAGGIAHDFNNLLTAMIGFCDLLLMRHPAGDQSFADIMQIKQNASRAANLVRQLLAFSRKQTLKSEVISITDALADLANLIRRLIGENIEFTLNHERELWPIMADQGQFEQVVINLAVNARDAMNNAGALTIRTENITVDKSSAVFKEFVFPDEDNALVPGDYACVHIEDSGQGIPPDLMRKIFEPFFSTKGVGEGTGLGLSTVYGIVKQSGGSICVKSKQDEGTHFCLYFPRHIPSESADDASEKPTAAINDDAIDLTGSACILLVEDEAPVRIFSARALRNKGYTVLEADGGEAAIEVVAEHKGGLDLIISDVVMPGMTGPQMVEHIQKEQPDLKVIFISGYAEDAFVETYGASRDFNFLAKPFSLKQLALKVKEVLAA